jgi:hypothetical protein
MILAVAERGPWSKTKEASLEDIGLTFRTRQRIRPPKRVAFSVGDEATPKTWGIVRCRTRPYVCSDLQNRFAEVMSGTKRQAERPKAGFNDPAFSFQNNSFQTEAKARTPRGDGPPQIYS